MVRVVCLFARMARVEIDLEGDVPRYVQIAAIIRDRIASGEYQPRQRIPSELDIVQAAGVSRETARKAIAILRDEGLIYTVHAMGSFVSPR